MPPSPRYVVVVVVAPIDDFQWIHWKTLSARKGKEGACLVAVGTCGTRLFDSRFIDTLWWIFKRICVVCSSSVFVETQRRAASVDAGAPGSQSAEGRAADDSPATQRVGRNTLEKTPCLCVVERLTRFYRSFHFV